MANGEPRNIDDVKDAQARKLLSRLCADYRDLAEQEAAIKAAKQALMEDIKAAASKAKVTARSPKLAGDGWLLVRAEGHSTKIEAEKLLERGVSLKTIEDSTVERTWTYFQVRSLPGA